MGSPSDGAARAGGVPPPALTWLGHATVLVELDGVRILTDPLLRRRAGPLVRIAPPVSAGWRARIDAVAISHLHADHVDLASLRMVTGPRRIIAPRGSGRWLARHGLAAEELSPGETATVGTVRITATPAAHNPRGLPRRPAAPPCGYLLSGSQSCYFAGDTDLFSGMSDLAGRVDTALLPIWGWGPTLGPGHMDPARAAQAAAIIAPRVAIPIHWGTYALPAYPRRRRPDPWLPAIRFRAAMAAQAPGVELRVLAPGETTRLTGAHAGGGR